ncbi:MAG: ketoacyl-ACP synthase III [Spirochaetes bacterium]|nr:ketoacyl-ACP synthase III [Spirochaetota bacterium]
MPLYKATIAATASYLPEKVVTNHDLTKTLDTSHEWIFDRSGISSRHIAADDEPASAMGIKAVRKLLEKHPINPADIDLIIVPTSTPDMVFPATACIIQSAIGATNAGVFDLSAACSGYVFSINTAAVFIESGKYKNVLVVATEKYSTILNWQDRSTAFLFGDAANATLLTRAEEGHGIIAMHGGTDGGKPELLCIPAGGSKNPVTAETVKNRMSTVHMKGGDVYKNAVPRFTETIEAVIAKAGLRKEDIALIIPHQANIRIIKTVAKELGMSADKFMVNLEHYANTSSASIGLALEEALAAGRIRTGDYVVLSAFGAGFSWGSTLIRW